MASYVRKFWGSSITTSSRTTLRLPTSALNSRPRAERSLSVDVLKRAGIDAPGLEPLQLADLVWEGIGITLLRGGEEAASSWQVWVGAENFDKLWDALVAAGASPVDLRRLSCFASRREFLVTASTSASATCRRRLVRTARCILPRAVM